MQYIRSYATHWRPFLRPQPEDAPCRRDGGRYKQIIKFRACSNCRTGFGSQYGLTCLRGKSASNCATNRESLPLVLNSFHSVLFGHIQEMRVTKFVSPVGRLDSRGTELLRFRDFIRFISNSAPNAMYLEDFTVKRL